jgi:erythromycin esterase-like protein
MAKEQGANRFWRGSNGTHKFIKLSHAPETRVERRRKGRRKQLPGQIDKACRRAGDRLSLHRRRRADWTMGVFVAAKERPEMPRNEQLHEDPMLGFDGCQHLVFGKSSVIGLRHFLGKILL